MTKIKSYDDFLKEGVKDRMTPKSVEDIMSTLDTNPENIIKTMKKIGITEDKFHDYIISILPKEKIRNVFLDYICENKERLRSTNYFEKIATILDDLIYYMNKSHNDDASVSLNSSNDEVYNEVTLRLYQELTDEEMKKVIIKAIKNE